MYEKLLAAIGDPNHPEHSDMMEWIGGEFDPEAFELAEVNQAHGCDRPIVWLTW